MTSPDSRIPEGKEVTQAIEVGKFTPTGAQYVHTVFSQLVDRYDLETSKALLNQIGKYAEMTAVKYAGRTDGPWDGGKTPTSFDNYQEDRAAKAISLLQSLQEVINMPFAVSDVSQFIRGWNSQGGLSDQIKEALDDLFKYWLYQKNEPPLVIDDHSTICEGDKRGRARVENGQHKKADAQAMREAIREGFKAFMGENGIQVHTKQNPFPAEKVDASLKAPAVQQAEAKQAVAAGKASAPVETSEAEAGKQASSRGS